jgi:signal peptidase I
LRRHRDVTDTSSETESAAPPPARHAKPAAPKKASSSFWRELPFLVVVALLLALLIKTFLVQAFYIPSASMENTLQGGQVNAADQSVATPAHPFDRVLVNKLVYDFRDPHRGEIVVFKRPPRWPNESEFTTSSNPVLRGLHDFGSAIGIAPSGGSDFIKRVIGISGDHVVCCNARHQVSVNGKALTEPYIDLEGGQPEDAYRPFTVTVPKGELFVMGDHRDDSDDSRVNGAVPISDVVGRAFLVIWPVKDWKHLPVPKTFDQPGLSAAGIGAAPYLAGGIAVLPLAWWRRRRRGRRRSYARTDG